MKNIKIQLFVTALAVCGLAGALALSNSEATQTSSEDGPAKDDIQAQSAKITTVAVFPSNHQAFVTGFGEAKASRSLSLTAEVTGRVLSLSPNLMSGYRFKEGDELLRIDDALYQQAYASAKSELATAAVELLQQQLNQKQAQAEWKRSGLKGKPDSALVLYTPQVKASQAKVEYARKQMTKTRSDLKKTIIKAPFNSQLITHSAEKGSYVQAGTEIAQLFDTDAIEIAIPLSTQQWNNLPDIQTMIAVTAVKLTSVDGTQTWIGRVNREEQYIDTTSRQRSIIIGVANPLDIETPLFPGTFLRAEIAGKALDNLWKIPSSALTQDNQIWYITEQGTIEQAAAEFVFSQGDDVYLKPIKNMKHAKIAAIPLSSYLPGMRVIDKNAPEATITKLAAPGTEIEQERQP